VEIINGKKLAQEILDELKNFFKRKKIAIAVISVGELKIHEAFIKQKQKAAAFLGIEFFHFHFDDKISNKILREKINEIAKRPFIKGLVLQLPLPKKFNSNALANVIPIEKDVDVLNERHFGRFCLKRSQILPPAVEVLKFILEKYKIDYKDKIFGVVGAGRLIGLPVINWLSQQKTTFFVVDINTKNPQKIIQNCDVVISGVGRAKLINKKWIKKGAVVIDFGFERSGDGVSGDVDFDSVKKRARLITPTPGGAGPLLVAMIYKNLKNLLMKNQS